MCISDRGGDTLLRVKNCGSVDYWSEMPKVFRYSKINLNFTIPNIKSGLPLRIFDVLGAGGFLLTNYQAELPDHFEIGKDLACFESEAELVEKCSYYLAHEEERQPVSYTHLLMFHGLECCNDVYVVVGIPAVNQNIHGVAPLLSYSLPSLIILTVCAVPSSPPKSPCQPSNSSFSPFRLELSMGLNACRSSSLGI